MGMNHTEFMALFDEWAPSYDETVFRREAVDGFEDYQTVLQRVAQLAGTRPGVKVLDVGTGTGNLAQVLKGRGANVLGVEPSAAMRCIARQKGIEVTDGHFLALPASDRSMDAVVSTYAFHHLTDLQKVDAAREMLRTLRPGGLIVIGDIAWLDDQAREMMVCRFAAQGKGELIQEIEAEYYPTIGVLTSVFARCGCTLYIERVNDWVWILVARKSV